MTLFSMNGREPLDQGHPDFHDLSALEADLLAAVDGQQVFEEKLRSFFRSAIDEVIDTARTGRFLLSDIEKTEKTYLGTKFEILLRDWLQVPRGVILDLLIGGIEVDDKRRVGLDDSARSNRPPLHLASGERRSVDLCGGSGARAQSLSPLG